jgi:hypothetical protein
MNIEGAAVQAFIKELLGKFDKIPPNDKLDNNDCEEVATIVETMLGIKLLNNDKD